MVASNCFAQFEIEAWRGNKTFAPLPIQDLNGQSGALASHEGHPVLINFWATWCEPCKEELPSLQTLAQLEGKEQLAVLTINVAESKTVVQRFVQKTDLQLPVFMDPERRLAKAMGVHIYPSTYLLDVKGRVRFVVHGALDWTQPEVQRWLKALHNASAVHE